MRQHTELVLLVPSWIGLGLGAVADLALLQLVCGLMVIVVVPGLLLTRLLPLGPRGLGHGTLAALASVFLLVVEVVILDATPWGITRTSMVVMAGVTTAVLLALEMALADLREQVDPAPPGWPEWPPAPATARRRSPWAPWVLLGALVVVVSLSTVVNAG